jgi:peptidoglycan/LPS O-acetylase OafA/YrhL
LPRITIVFGALLIVLGLVAYFGMQEPGARSVTALIPAFIGLPLLVLGLVAEAKPGSRKHTMHAAAALGLLGFLGTVGGFIKALQWMGGTVPERPAAVRVQAIMAVMSVIFIVLCVRSFIAARKARQAGFPLD